MRNSDSAPIALISAALVRERKRAGCSLSEIAKRASIAKSTLSQLESGVGNPSLETLWALCGALEIPFARLIEPSKAQVQIIRRGEGVSVSSEQSNYSAILLATCPPAARRDIYSLSTQPGSDRLSTAHGTGVVEHLIITSGKALVGLVEQPVELSEGDYISYPGDQPHIFRALAADTTAILVMEQN